MSRPARVVALVAALASCLGGCGLRQVFLDIYVPQECEPEGSRPLAGIDSVHTRLVSVDGSEIQSDCVAAGGIERYGDLEQFTFLRRSEALAGVEVEITGFENADCEGRHLLRCDSFGEATIDLADTSRVAVWCECALSALEP